MSRRDFEKDEYLGIAVSKGTIQRLSKTAPGVSAVKLAVFVLLIAGGATLYILFDNIVLRIAAIILLGITYAHGVELQHEALHGNLFGGSWLDRAIGFLLGLPMLVSYTQYRAYHLHHHRCVGTAMDEELFDYTSQSLRNPLSAFVRIWNLVKIPAFLVTFINMLQGEYPDKVKSADRRALLMEYMLMIALFSTAIAGWAWFGNSTIVLLWSVPWLAVAEPVHFLIEVPEHIGCDRKTRSILKNTRSYPVNPLWAYLTNFNNFHIEHHLFPTVPAHRLRQLHAKVRKAEGHCSDSYSNALSEILATVGRERRSQSLPD